MASLIHRKDRGREGWLISFYTADKLPRSLWLGEVSKRTANNVKRHVEELVRAQKANSRPEGDSEKWAEGTEGRLRDSLVKFGLAQPAQAKPTDDASLYLGPFIDHYISCRTDLKGITINQFKQVRSWAVAYLGERKPLTAITQADFEQWLRWMTSEPTETEIKSKVKTKPLSKSSANKHAKRFKQVLEFAVKSRLLKENPGRETSIGSEVNPSRQSFITRATAKLILAKCPDIQWKLIFALPRFAGLRCPTEVLSLTWGDVDWDRNRLRIDSVKTGLRWCPLFPELRKLLEQALEEAPQKRSDAHVILQYRGNEINLRTNLLRIIKAAGCEQWPKLFVNLRSSCRTELEEEFPSHVIDQWLGHSTAVARKHYLQITDEHWERASVFQAGEAIEGEGIATIYTPQGNEPIGDDHDNQKPIGAVAGAVIHANQELATVGSDSNKPNKNKAQRTSDESSKLGRYPRQGSNSNDIAEGKQHSGQTAHGPAQLIFSDSFSVVLADFLGHILETLTTTPTLSSAIAFAAGYLRPQDSQGLTFPVVLPTALVLQSQGTDHSKPS